jgi:hypothetical protein
MQTLPLHEHIELFAIVLRQVPIVVADGLHADAPSMLLDDLLHLLETEDLVPTRVGTTASVQLDVVGVVPLVLRLVFFVLLISFVLVRGSNFEVRVDCASSPLVEVEKKPYNESLKRRLKVWLGRAYLLPFNFSAASSSASVGVVAKLAGNSLDNRRITFAGFMLAMPWLLVGQVKGRSSHQ